MLTAPFNTTITTKPNINKPNVGAFFLKSPRMLKFSIVWPKLLKITFGLMCIIDEKNVFTGKLLY